MLTIPAVSTDEGQLGGDADRDVVKHFPGSRFEVPDAPGISAHRKVLETSSDAPGAGSAGPDPLRTDAESAIAELESKTPGDR